jgi:DNA-binding LacI/PurR family transcriptional regulator
MICTMRAYKVMDKKYIEIAEQLRSEILSGKYRVGEKIPPIRELAIKYHANPQTVNKATAYLASLGYLEPRQGRGCVVTQPDDGHRSRKGIWMLIDRERSKLLSNLDEVSNYHAKDIYLTYLLIMSRRGGASGFTVYDREATEVPADFLDQLKSVSGFIVQGRLPEAYVRILEKENIPAVFINRPVPPGKSGRFGSILIDNTPIQQLVNYLISLGHRKILYLLSTEFEENEVFKERFHLVESTASAWGKNASIIEVFRYSLGEAESIRSFQEKVEEGFSAGIGYNDTSALGAYALANACGYDIPSDISIAGFDDIMAAKTAIPPLTTIRVNRSLLTSKAIELLDELMKSNDPVRLSEILPTELVIRRSVIVNHRKT